MEKAEEIKLNLESLPFISILNDEYYNKEKNTPQITNNIYQER